MHREQLHQPQARSVWQCRRPLAHGHRHPSSWRGQGRPFYRLLLLLLCTPVFGDAQEIATAQTSGAIDPIQEYNVKGAFLYSFGRYVTWPPHTFADDVSPFQIGVLGDAPIGRILDRIRTTKTVQQRRIVVRTFKSLDEYEPCHILFIARSISVDQQKLAIEKLAESNVLLVGETPGFAEWGGPVNFYISEDSVKFEINGDAARREQLTIDAKLLSVARIVRQAGTK